MRILFVGESWKGSSARSLRESIVALPNLQVEDIGEDHYFAKGQSLVVRGAKRLFLQWHSAELNSEIKSQLKSFRPDVLMVYKGTCVSAEAIQYAKSSRILAVNVFPDNSPKAHGSNLSGVIGTYDLVVSTKRFHPGAWSQVYGYSNRCVYVPHGYDPDVHFRTAPAEAHDLDIVLASTWRPQYGDVMKRLAKSLSGMSLRVGIVGSGWIEQAAQFPSDWEIGPALSGQAYGDWLRRGRIALAPVTRDVIIKGVVQPGDEDTTRTYELAALGCFFLHRRTPHVRSLYDETTEVPMWEDADELTELIKEFLPRPAERIAMARRAHERAVPRYSIPARAAEVITEVQMELEAQGASR